MPMQRIIPKFLLKGGRLVKRVRFDEREREAGNPVSTAKVYDAYGVDEMVFLDIEATVTGHGVLHATIERVAREIFMPVTVGGGVRTLDDVERLLRSGADKVAVNTRAVEDPAFIAAAARRFGDQCITVSVDYREVEPGVFRVFTHGGRTATAHEPIAWCRRMQDQHCGEILLSSIDRDGTMSGYDLEMIRGAVAAVDIPVVASSGAGSLQHCREALAAGASGITISSMFFFTDHSPIKVRTYLASNGVPVRSQKGSRS